MRKWVIAVFGMVAVHALPKLFDIECECCRSWCSMSEVKREETGSCNIMLRESRQLVSKRRKGKDGKCSVDVPGVRTFYEVTYLCRRCGHTVIRQDYADTKLSVEGE